MFVVDDQRGPPELVSLIDHMTVTSCLPPSMFVLKQQGQFSKHLKLSCKPHTAVAVMHLFHRSLRAVARVWWWRLV